VILRRGHDRGCASSNIYSRASKVAGSRFRRRACIRSAAELFRQPISLANLTRAVLQRVHSSPGPSWKSASKIRVVRVDDGARRAKNAPWRVSGRGRGTDTRFGDTRQRQLRAALPSTARLPAQMGDACLYPFMHNGTTPPLADIVTSHANIEHRCSRLPSPPSARPPATSSPPPPRPPRRPICVSLLMEQRRRIKERAQARSVARAALLMFTASRMMEDYVGSS